MTLIAATDIETTGLNIGDDRIIEIYSGLWDVATKMQVDQQLLRINPQRSIAAEAQRLHKITLSDLTGCPVWADVAAEVRAFLARGAVLIGHNAREFDGPFLNYEFERVGVDRLETPIIDTMLSGRWATHNGRVPALADLCFATGITYDAASAHRADYDVKVMMDAFFRGLAWKRFSLPEELAIAA